MKRRAAITAASLLSIILLSLHFADDIAYGSDKSAISNIISAAILVVWLYGTLVLAGRRSGYVIMLLGSVAGLVVFGVHESRTGGLSAGSLALSSGVFFFTWTLIALAVTSAFTGILSTLGLWDTRHSRKPQAAAIES